MIIYFTNHTTLREVLYLIIFKIKTSLYVYFCRLPGWCRWMKTGKDSRNISNLPPPPPVRNRRSLGKMERYNSERIVWSCLQNRVEKNGKENLQGNIL